MLVPEEIPLVSGGKLVRYTPDFVEQYYDWFVKFPELLNLTGTEPFSLQDEIENQRITSEDPFKVVFLIKDLDGMLVGDVNCFITQDNSDESLDFVIGEINVMIAEPSARRKGLASESIKVLMEFVEKKFPEINSFIAKIDFENLSSQNLFKSLGFTEVGRSSYFKEIRFEKKCN